MRTPDLVRKVSPSSFAEIDKGHENSTSPPRINAPQIYDSEPPTSSRRERTNTRDISPYAYATTNGLAAAEEEWDEAKGDLKKMRARKRLNLPATAHYSYLSGPPQLSDDVDWEER